MRHINAKNLLLILGWLIGFRWVENNHVKPVMRLGMYNRVGGPGFFWIIPFIETTLPSVKMGLHIAPLILDEVLTRNCVACRIHLTVLFNFNPKLAIKDAAAQLVQANVYLLQLIVRDYANQGIRRLVSQFDSQELWGTATASYIERNLTRFLMAKMHSLGISPLRNDGILIGEIILPEMYKQPVLNTRHLDLTIQTIAPFPEPKLIEQASQAMLVSNLEGKNVTIMMSDFARKEAEAASYVMDIGDLLKQKKHNG